MLELVQEVEVALVEGTTAAEDEAGTESKPVLSESKPVPSK